jgi:hypothetical protein
MPHPAILGSALLILLLLFILLALLLLVPIDLEGRVARGGDGPETKMRIGWLFGRLSKDVFSGSDEREPSKKGEKLTPEKGKENDEKEEEGEAEGGLGSFRVALEVLRTEGFLRNLERLLRGLLGAIRVQFLRIDLVIGLPDPAETGEAVGLLWAALAPLEALAPLMARIAPSFSDGRLEGSAEGRLRIWPYRTIPTLVRFLLAPSTWRAGWRGIRARRGKG